MASSARTLRPVGHVFQGRFNAVLVQKDSHLLEVCRYVVLNPSGPRRSGIHGSGNGVATVPRQGSSSLMVVSLLMKYSVISVSGRPTPRKSIPSLFKPESATLQSGTILRPRVCWESKGLRRDSDTWRRKSNRFERYRRVKDS